MGGADALRLLDSYSKPAEEYGEDIACSTAQMVCVYASNGWFFIGRHCYYGDIMHTVKVVNK